MYDERKSKGLKRVRQNGETEKEINTKNLKEGERERKGNGSAFAIFTLNTHYAYINAFQNNGRNLAHTKIRHLK